MQQDLFAALNEFPNGAVLKTNNKCVT